MSRPVQLASSPAPTPAADDDSPTAFAAAEKNAAALTLDERGMICDCNRAGEMLFKYRRSEMVWRHVSMLLPQLADAEMTQDGQPNPRLRFLCRIGRRFQVATHDGEHFACELFFNVLDKKRHGRLLLIIRPAETAPGDGNRSRTSPDHETSEECW